jgi:Arc/MetJ-type ribon-helix-helix transcriptional regulator
METSAKTARKPRRGAGPDAVTTVRLPETLRKQIDRWRREHGAKTRSDAICRLLKQALGTDPGRRISRKFAAQASDLAGRAIDRLTDPSATTEEQAKRKRRLIEGPREFRAAGRKS